MRELDEVLSSSHDVKRGSSRPPRPLHRSRIAYSQRRQRNSGRKSLWEEESGCLQPRPRRQG